MPGLFGSRRRGSSAQPPVDRISSTNAAAAASQAMYQSGPTAPLSSAAAAAALRSASTTPEPIGNLQTKRMIRRGSVSSIGSNISNTGRGGAANGRSASLTRPASASSMSERTFRGQSPARDRAVSPAVNAPPVPALPDNIPDARHRRSNSLEPPQRVTSPTPAKGERSASVDPHTTRILHSQPPPSAKRNSKRLSDVAEELERSDSTRNRNFSRPIATPSPPASPATANMSKPAGRPAATTRAQALEQKIARIQAAAAPQANTSTSWAAAAPTTGQGSHLAQSNRSAPAPAPIKTAAPQPREQEMVMIFDPNTRTFVPRMRDKPKVVQPASPALPPPKAPVPGTYDPNTRSIVPHPPSSAPTTQSTSSLSPRASARSSPATSPSPVTRVPQSQPPAARKDPGAPGQQGLLTPSPSVTKMPAASPKTPVLAKPATTTPAVASGGRVVGGRTLSTSPSPVRSAHFSASPVIEATKHEPPARSISPAKSALKHSPAPSLRAASPLAHLSSIGPPSEISDTASQTSQDGSSAKKKKSVRVSFEEQAQEIAPAKAVSSPRALSFGRAPASEEDSDDEIMKPRPALPSFGSVRRNRPDVAEKVTEVPPARTTEASSSDHAVGAVLAGAAAAKQAGYESDDSEDAEKIGVATSGEDAPPAAATPATAKAVTADVIPTEEGDAIPSIELLPPTPGEEGKPLGDAAETASDTSEEPVTQPPPAEEESPVAPLAAIDEDSDDSNQFSDAPEDLSDNGGFISLDAVAVSPINATSNTRPTSYAESPPASPSVQQAAKKGHQRASVVRESSPHHGSGDWSEATQYWSKLSKQQKEQIEREEETARAASPTNESKAKIATATAGAAVVGTAVAAAASQKPAAPKATTAAQPAKPAMKKSMRAQPAEAASEPDASMRRTMRNGTASGMATSLRNGPPPPRQGPAPAAAPHPNGSTTVKPQDSSYPRIDPRPANKPAANRVSQPAPIVSTRLQKELAEDSDSESSFRRKKKSGAAAANGRYTMKRSMRGAPARSSSAAAAPRRESRPTSPEPLARGKDSFSMRSLSPSGSLFNRHRGEQLRSSLRSGSVDAANSRMSLRGPPPAASAGGRRRPTSSASMSSFGARPASVAGVPPPPAKYKSRFADSDSEDEGGSGGGFKSMGFFRSRFGAESDEDDDDVFIPADLTPVRGIPRRSGQHDGDSTDLEDSDDEPAAAAAPAKGKKAKPGKPTEAEIDAAMDAARKKLGIAAPADGAAKPGTALARGSLRGKANGDANNHPPPEPKSRPEDVRDSPPPPSVAGSEAVKKKRGLMGSLLRRNRSSVASVPTVADLSAYPPSPALATPTKPTAPGTTAPPAAVTTPPPAAAATGPATDTPSPFTKLLRNSAPPALKRGDSNYSTMTAPPDVRPPTAGGLDPSWPLPPVPPIPASILSARNTRPSTSDGIGGGDIETASAPGDRRTSVRFMEIDEDIAAAAGKKGAAGGAKEKEARAVYSQRTGKKKKFGVLRRAFGLND